MKNKCVYVCGANAFTDDNITAERHWLRQFLTGPVAKILVKKKQSKFRFVVFIWGTNKTLSPGTGVFVHEFVLCIDVFDHVCVMRAHNLLIQCDTHFAVDCIHIYFYIRMQGARTLAYYIPGVCDCVCASACVYKCSYVCVSSVCVHVSVSICVCMCTYACVYVYVDQADYEADQITYAKQLYELKFAHEEE